MNHPLSIPQSGSNVKEIQNALQLLQDFLGKQSTVTPPVSTGGSLKPEVQEILRRRVQTHFKRKPINV